jgi:hypothetical protein
MRVTILSGVSGSGKTTLAENDTSGVIVSADHYFMTKDGRYCFDSKSLTAAHARCFRNFIDGLRSGMASHIIVDNTNTTEAEISPYVLGAQAFGASVEVVTIHVPTYGAGDLAGSPYDPFLDQCAARNKHGVPRATIEAQAKRMLARKLPPWWNTRTVTPTYEKTL